MSPEPDDQSEIEATEEQIEALRKLGVAEVELTGLSSADAEEWIDELREKRIDAGRFGPPGR
jgi:hypothetical protein